MKFCSLFLIISTFVILFYSCATLQPNLKTLSVTAPDVVVAKQDSLLALSKDKRPEFVTILTTAHINIARRAESSGDISVAMDEYQKVLKIDPSLIKARYWLGKEYRIARKYQKAIEQLKLFLDDQSNNPNAITENLIDANFELAKALKFSKKFEEAIPRFNKVLELDPKAHGARLLLGITFVDSGKIEKGIDEIKSYIRVDGYNPWPHHELGRALTLSKEF